VRIPPVFGGAAAINLSNSGESPFSRFFIFWLLSFRYGLFNSVGRAPDAAGLHIGGRF
jgi:hypothetical protein